MQMLEMRWSSVAVCSAPGAFKALSVQSNSGGGRAKVCCVHFSSSEWFILLQRVCSAPRAHCYSD
jgi:hypothetical protein